MAGLSAQAFSVLTSTAPSSGVQTVGIGQSGVQFDLGNTGTTNANVGWITPGEGFLVNLPEGATTITNGSELFGTATVLPNGQTASNGFAALSAFDQNGSGTIDASDPIFNQLKVWVDTGVAGESGVGGASATTPTGTLFTLAQLNIQSLNLSASVANQASNGNTVGLVSSYTTTDGQTHELADVWLASTAGTGSTISQLTNALSQYAATGSVTSGGGAALSGNPGAANTNGVTQPDTQSATQASSALTSSTTSVLASALSQYNANGQLITSSNNSTFGLSNIDNSVNQLVGNHSTNSTFIAKTGSNIASS